MPRRKAKDMTVGAMAALALLVLAVGVMTVGEGSQLFTPKVAYRVVFPNTDGLRVGSPVKMSGVQVGTVSAIRLPENPEAPGIEVKIAVAKNYAPRIREDSRAALRYLQFLSGEKYVEVTPGSPAQPAVAEGAVITPMKQTEFLEQGADIAENLNEITVALREILEPLQKGEGLLGTMIQDPEFGKRGVEAFTQVLEDLKEVTGSIRRGRGLVGRLLNDPGTERVLDDLQHVVHRLASVTEALEKREGALGALLEEGGPADQAIADFQAAVASLRRTAERLESDESLMGRMLNDPDYAERVSGDLEALLANLREISDKLNAGQGTLGALLNERTLYDGLEDVVAGVNDSKFARWLLRHYQKRGIKARTRAEKRVGEKSE